MDQGTETDGDADVDDDDMDMGNEQDMQDGDEADETDQPRFRVFGNVPGVKDIFFSPSSGNSRERPMEKIFRHYVNLATARNESGKNTSSASGCGNEIVPFHSGPSSVDFPFSLFTPEQIENLRARHHRKKKRQAAIQEREQHFFNTESGEGSGSSWRFQELDSSDDADVSSSAEESDFEMSMDCDGEGKAPHLAGTLSHGEWFVEADDDDDKRVDVDTQDDDL
ncbi:hypothetical protein PINS_up005137 [Pythium insidiosum]|nr:hypothetical protein PINS_up005137 [Pythium insidiosum]